MQIFQRTRNINVEWTWIRNQHLETNISTSWESTHQHVDIIFGPKKMPGPICKTCLKVGSLRLKFRAGLALMNFHGSMASSPSQSCLWDSVCRIPFHRLQNFHPTLSQLFNDKLGWTNYWSIIKLSSGMHISGDDHLHHHSMSISYTLLVVWYPVKNDRVELSKPKHA